MTDSLATRSTDHAPALVLCAHGINGQAGVVTRHARAIPPAQPFASIHGAALHGDPRLETVLNGLAGRTIVLVPYMMAEGYTLETLKRRVAGHEAAPRVRIARPIGTARVLTDLIGEMGNRTCLDQGWRTRSTALLLVGHGTRRNPASGRTAEAHLRELCRTGAFAEVAAAFLDQTPSIADAVTALTARHIVAVGFFTDAGNHGADDVPEHLAGTGRTAVYAGPIGTDRRLPGLLRQHAEGMLELVDVT